MLVLKGLLLYYSLCVCVGGEEVTQPVARQPQWDKYFFSKNLKLGF